MAHKEATTRVRLEECTGDVFQSSPSPWIILRKSFQEVEMSVGEKCPFDTRYGTFGSLDSTSHFETSITY